MAHITNSYISCGVNELYDMCGDGEDTVRAMWENYCKPEIAFGTRPKAAFVIFSHTVADGVPSPLDDIGEIHANYIEKNGVGKVTRGPIEMNPNSGNKIRIYIVTIDVEALRKFGAKKGWL